MAKDGDELYGINLDTKDASEKLLSLKAQLDGLGGTDSLKGLLEGMASLGIVAGVVGGAVLAAKLAFDWTLEAESIKSVEENFNRLATQSGVDSEKLKSGLEKASDGLVDMNDLLKISNNSMVAMGASAARLPEILELARKSAAITGKTVEETFSAMTEAISRGQTRGLKNLGIIVDQSKAYKAYADSIGESVEALSKQGQMQAVLNAALEVGNKSLGSVDSSMKPATTAWNQFKVTLQETKEMAILAFDKTMGPNVTALLSTLRDAAVVAKDKFAILLGAGNQAEVEATKRQIAAVEDSINTHKKTKGSTLSLVEDLVFGDQVKYFESQKAKLEAHLADLESKIAKSKAEAKAKTDAAKPLGAVGGVAPEKEGVDEEKKRDLAAKFNKEMFAIRKGLSVLMDQQATSDADFEIAQKQRLIDVETGLEEKKEAVSTNKALTAVQKAKEYAALESLASAQRKAAEIKNIDEAEKWEVTSLERRIKLEKSRGDKFVLGMELANAKAKKSLVDFGAFGEATANGLGNAFGSAFEQVGAGGISLGEALKKSMIGAVADIAKAKGRALILSSIWPPDPLGLAAGAALEAFGGLLAGAVGSSSSVPSGGSTAGGGAAPSGFTASGAATAAAGPVPDASQMQQQRKVVTLNVQGSIFNTDETRRQITQMVRDESDATDFKIFGVGGVL